MESGFLDQRSPVLAELTPVVLDDNTTAKVPYTAGNTPQTILRVTSTANNEHDTVRNMDGNSGYSGDIYAISPGSVQGSYRCESGQVLNADVDDPDASLIFVGDDVNTSIEGRINSVAAVFRAIPKICLLTG